MYLYIVGLEEVTEIACVCKTDALACDKVVLHFYNNGCLALAVEVVCDFTACKTAADYGNLVAYLLVAEKIVYCFNGCVRTLYGNLLCYGTRCDYYFVCIECIYVRNFGTELYFNGML